MTVSYKTDLETGIKVDEMGSINTTSQRLSESTDTLQMSHEV